LRALFRTWAITPCAFERFPDSPPPTKDVKLESGNVMLQFIAVSSGDIDAAVLAVASKAICEAAGVGTARRRCVSFQR
jgi:hypothetical protein